MPDYRIYRRASTVGFDGATLETAVYTQQRYQWTTATDTAVGEWEPASIGRQSVASLVSVAADLTGGGDTVAVVSPSATVRASTALTLDGSSWLLAYPGDSVRVTSATARSIELAVQDLSDEQLVAWIAAQEQAAAISGQQYSEVQITANGQIAAWSGRRTGFINFAVIGNVILPDLADVALGDSIFLVRVAGAGDVGIQTANALDEVNGIAGVAASQYNLRSIGEGVLYTRVSGGWTRKEGAQAPPPENIAALPAAPQAVREGTGYTEVTAVGPGAVTLPTLVGQPVGARYAILNTGTDAISVQSTGGQLIDGLAAASTVQPNDSVVYEAGLTSWYTGRGVASPEPQSLAVNTVMARFRGVATVEMTGGAGQTLELPPLSQTRFGDSVVVFNNSANAHIINVFAGDLIDGGAGPLASASGQKTLIVSAGPTIGWIGILSA